MSEDIRTCTNSVSEGRSHPTAHICPIWDRLASHARSFSTHNPLNKLHLSSGQSDSPGRRHQTVATHVATIACGSGPSQVRIPWGSPQMGTGMTYVFVMASS